MGKRLRDWGLACLLGVAGALAAAPAASGDHHAVLISELHHESDGAPSQDWVELQFLADGQNLLATHYLHMYDTLGDNFGAVPLDTVPNGGSQRTVLIGSGGILGADQNDPGARVYFAGTACYSESVSLVSSIDCVVWGPPDVSGGSSPAVPAGPELDDDQTLQRTLARGCPTALDAADDTNSTAADFALGPESPANNAAPPSGTPCQATAPPADQGTPKKKKKKCKKKKKKRKGRAGAAAKKKKKKCKKKRKGKSARA